jgi:hypothetical protein
MDSDEKTKTGCAGILIPLFFAAYALKWILSKRAGPVGLRNIGHPPMTGDAAVGFGIMTLGICLFVHALGFVPYERVRGLKYILAAAGVSVFLLGLLWEQIHT